MESVNNNTPMILNFIYQFPAIIHLNFMTVKYCLLSLFSWFSHNGLSLNPENTDAVLFGIYQSLKNVIFNDMAKSVAQALVSSRLEYANSKLFGVSKQNIAKLERSQNKMTRMVTQSSRYNSTIIQL